MSRTTPSIIHDSTGITSTISGLRYVVPHGVLGNIDRYIFESLDAVVHVVPHGARDAPTRSKGRVPLNEPLYGDVVLRGHVDAGGNVDARAAVDGGGAWGVEGVALVVPGAHELEISASGLLVAVGICSTDVRVDRVASFQAGKPRISKYRKAPVLMGVRQLILTFHPHHPGLSQTRYQRRLRIRSLPARSRYLPTQTSVKPYRINFGRCIMALAALGY